MLDLFVRKSRKSRYSRPCYSPTSRPRLTILEHIHRTFVSGLRDSLSLFGNVDLSSVSQLGPRRDNIANVPREYPAFAGSDSQAAIVRAVS